MKVKPDHRTKEEKVFAFLRQHGYIDEAAAIRHYNIYNLPKVISNLRTRYNCPIENIAVADTGRLSYGGAKYHLTDRKYTPPIAFYRHDKNDVRIKTGTLKSQTNG